MSIFDLIFPEEHKCPECGAQLEWEDEYEETLVCPECGWECDSDHFRLTDEEYDAQYPTKEEVCGYDDEEDEADDDCDGEYYEEYEEEFDELSDD
ncbi:MAG: DNA-directed RNA polymerase I [Oscillospiraceae bacterium]|nr:DNA-directed RNA polymerase I [Oscillospiraceae bacterium]